MATKIFFSYLSTGEYENETFAYACFYAETGEIFYAETVDYNRLTYGNEYIDNKIENCCIYKDKDEFIDVVNKKGNAYSCFTKAKNEFVIQELYSWLNQFDSFELWSHGRGADYEFYMFNNVFNNIKDRADPDFFLEPHNIDYLFIAHGIDRHIGKEEFLGVGQDFYKDYPKGNAIRNAMLIKLCYEKLDGNNTEYIHGLNHKIESKKIN